MKTTSLVLAVTLAIGLSSTVLASETAKPAKDPAVSKTVPPKQNDQLLTGSHVKQKVRRNGMVTDGANNVVVLDSETIRNSGASDLRQLLNRRGIR